MMQRYEEYQAKLVYERGVMKQPLIVCNVRVFVAKETRPALAFHLNDGQVSPGL